MWLGDFSGLMPFLHSGERVDKEVCKLIALICVMSKVCIEICVVFIKDGYCEWGYTEYRIIQHVR